MKLLWPQSLLGRLLAVFVGGILIAQIMATLFWITQIRHTDTEYVRDLSKQIASSVSSTAQFFLKFPVEYRHIVLDQLRNMGGTRYFVTLNEEHIEITDIGNLRLHQPIDAQLRKTIYSTLGNDTELTLNISRTDNLHVLNNETLLSDIPHRWAQDSLMISADSLLLVIQIRMDHDEWLYIAAPIPDALLKDDWEVLLTNQFPLLIMMLVVMIGMTFFIVRWLTQPLIMLSKAAQELGKDIDHPPLDETGTREVADAARAFNQMQERIRNYIQDRATMLSAISHDLKTPITRINLQVDLIGDDSLRESISEDIDDLNLMVKGALDCLKGTDIQESQEVIELAPFCTRLVEKYSLIGAELSLDLVLGEQLTMACKPLALKRCLSNLIDNALFYGERAEVLVVADVKKQSLQFRICDYGSGVPEDKLESLFAPYFRLDKSRNKNSGGIGLGLNIARNIARAHGGKLHLENTTNKGLLAVLTLPLE